MIKLRVVTHFVSTLVARKLCLGLRKDIKSFYFAAEISLAMNYCYCWH